MDASTLARIEFRQEIGTFTEEEQQALIYQLLMAAKRIKEKQWETVDIAEFSAPQEETPRVILPG